MLRAVAHVLQTLAGGDHLATEEGGSGDSRSGSAWAKAHVPPAWRRPRRLLLVGALLLAAIWLIVATRPTMHSAPATRVFPVGHRVALRFVHSTGSVRVRPGPGGQLSITEHRSGITGAIHTRYRQQGNLIAVTVSVGGGLPVATWVDFVVAVPQDMNLNLAVAAGTVRAAGVSGNLSLNDTNGAISAAHVSGAIALRTASGSINTSQVSGQVRAITDNGTITTVSTRLRGHSLMQAQNGTINFQGSLDAGCRAVFRNTNGAIGITLPRSSSALVNARSRFGSINSDFSTVRVASASPGQLANGRVGRGASARLNVQTVGGSINLGKRT